MAKVILACNLRLCAEALFNRARGFVFRELRSLGREGHLFDPHIQSCDLLVHFLDCGDLYQTRKDAP